MDRLDCDRMFIAVMELGSFAKAAERRGVSAGQASKLVSALERTLGVALLNRTTRALTPTEAGRAYFERIRVLIDDLDGLDDAIRGTARAPAGRLRIAAPASYGTHVLTDLMLGFAADYPDIVIDVGFADRFVNLVDEGFDVAIRIGSAGDSTLIARRVGDVRIVTVAAPAYLARIGRPQKIEDLKDHQLILDTNTREALIWCFRDPVTQDVVALPVDGRFKFSSAEACLTAAEAGGGITRIPLFVAEAAIAAGRIERILTDCEETLLPLFIVYPPSRHLAGKVRAFVDFMAKRLRV